MLLRVSAHGSYEIGVGSRYREPGPDLGSPSHRAVIIYVDFGSHKVVCDQKLFRSYFRLIDELRPVASGNGLFTKRSEHCE